jgi:splicing factor 3A subunit 3
MDSLIEVQRQTHEEIERFERALHTILSHNYASQESKLQSEHRASQILDRISARATSLSNTYADEEARKAEITLLSAPGGNQDDLAEFYARLVKIQDHYHKYPDSVPGGGFELELAAFLDAPEQDDDREHPWSTYPRY